ncbi:hypothetical protein AQUCO_01500436v1 [Aquilegia coerulea]|uniref:Protein kinase domain-containing protein n=1 Tax=Aquilegia coerulea TaxID=218851 RepID=A0A2G5DTQ3_AQUCA|nr:hypothetical protein AQUCO_01500436v1 [Aquilegia coerulea]
MGTPTEETWPGVAELPLYNSDFCRYPPEDLETMVSDLEPAGVDLLRRMLTLDPSQRITAQEALGHAYFQDP